MPPVPLLDTHGVDVELLVEVVKEGNRLDDHDIDLVGAEAELEAGEGVGETEGHGVHVVLLDAVEEVRELLADTAEEIDRGRVRDDVDVELLRDSGSQLRIHDSEVLGFLVVGDVVLQEFFHRLGQFAVLELGDVLEGLGGGVELVNGLEFEAVGCERGWLRGRLLTPTKQSRGRRTPCGDRDPRACHP